MSRIYRNITTSVTRVTILTFKYIIAATENSRQSSYGTCHSCNNYHYLTELTHPNPQIVLVYTDSGFYGLKRLTWQRRRWKTFSCAKLTWGQDGSGKNFYCAVPGVSFDLLAINRIRFPKLIFSLPKTSHVLCFYTFKSNWLAAQYLILFWSSFICLYVFFLFVKT